MTDRLARLNRLVEHANPSGPPRLPTSSVSRPVSPWRTYSILIGLRMTRLRNRFFGRWGSESSPSGGRRAASRHRMADWAALAVLVFVGFPVVTAFGWLQGLALPWLYGNSGQDPILSASAHLVVLTFGAFLLSIGFSNRDLNRLGADAEWLLTLPVSLTSLHFTKVLQRALLAPYAWLMVYPPLLAMVSRGEFSATGIAAAVLLSLPLFALMALAGVLLESAARVWLPRVLINSLQFFASVGGIALFLTFSLRPQWVAPLGVVPWPALSQAVSLALSQGGSHPWSPLRYLLETAALLAAGSALLRLVASRGAVVGAGSRQGRRSTRAADSLAGSWLADGVVVKDLLQFRRDKKALYAALSMPCLTLFQLALLTSSPRRAYLLESTAHLPALAFLAGSMAVLSVTSLLHLDGKALWLMFTFPRTMVGMLARRAVSWTPFCLGFALLPLGYGLPRQGLSLELAWRTAYCLTGLSLLTLIAAGLAVHGIDPDALEEERQSLRGGRQVALLMLLMATFAAGFYGDAWLSVTLLLLLGAVALGVGQDVSRQVPFLLEPGGYAPLRLGVSTGLTCLMVLLVLQVLGERVATVQFGLAAWPSRGAAFLGSVGLVAAVTLTRFWRVARSQVHSLGLTWGDGPRATLLEGLRWAPLAAAGGAAATLALHQLPGLDEWARAAARSQPALAQPMDWLVFCGLTLIGAPLCEELIFRGMIYAGLRESLSPGWSAALSAAVFVAIHPATAAIPASLVSLLAAAAFERSRSLVSSILVHIAYNAAVLITTYLSVAPAV